MMALLRACLFCSFLDPTSAASTKIIPQHKRLLKSPKYHIILRQDLSPEVALFSSLNLKVFPEDIRDVDIYSGYILLQCDKYDYDLASFHA